MTPKDRSREMRRNLTPPEVRIWKRLKRLRDQEFHFRRQYFFSGYYLDFVCLPYRLVVGWMGDSMVSRFRRSMMLCGTKS